MGVGGAAAVLGGGAVLGAVGQHQANKKNKANQKKIKKLTYEQLANLDPALASQEGYLKSAIRTEEAGFAATEARTEGVLNRGVQDTQAALLGSGTAAIGGRGLLGSSLDANMRVGVARQTNRARTDAQMALAALQGHHRSRRASNMREMGAFQAYKANARNAILGGYANQLANTSYASQAPDLGGLGMLLALSGGAGGGGGAAGGLPSNYSGQQLF